MNLTVKSMMILDQIFARAAIWQAILRRKELRNRYWLTTLAECLYDPTINYFHPDGSRYHLPDLDDVFNGLDEGRGMRQFLTPDETGNNTRYPVQRLLRLQMLELYLQCVEPDWELNAPHQE